MSGHTPDALREAERTMLHRIDSDEIIEGDEDTPAEMVFQRVQTLRPGQIVLGVISDQGSIKFGDYETVKVVEEEDDSLVVMIDFEDSLALTVPRLAHAVVLLDL